MHVCCRLTSVANQGCGLRVLGFSWFLAVGAVQPGVSLAAVQSCRKTTVEQHLVWLQLLQQQGRMRVVVGSVQQPCGRDHVCIWVCLFSSCSVLDHLVCSAHRNAADIHSIVSCPYMCSLGLGVVIDAQLGSTLRLKETNN
jgi:hypothetical protein